MSSTNATKSLIAQLDYGAEAFARLADDHELANIRTILSSFADDTSRHLEVLRSVETNLDMTDVIDLDDLRFPSVAVEGRVKLLGAVFTRKKSAALALLRLAKGTSDMAVRSHLFRMAQESKKLLLLARDRYDLERLNTP